MKEQMRLSRSSDIIPVLQVTVICLRGSLKAGPATSTYTVNEHTFQKANYSQFFFCSYEVF